MQQGLEGDKASLEEEKRDLQERTAALEEERRALKEEAARLGSRAASLETLRTGLDGQLEVQTQVRQDLEAEGTRLREQVASCAVESVSRGGQEKRFTTA